MLVSPMTRNQPQQINHPLDKATTILYARLEQLGPTKVREHYKQRDWNSLGCYEFCDYLGSPDVGTNFFLTALELWLSQQGEST